MANNGDRSRVAESTDPVRILEGLLRRAQVLNSTVNALQRDLASSHPLPPFATLQARTNSMRDSINDFVGDMDKHRDLLSTTLLTPTLTFPGRYHEAVLHLLLRTKMEPTVEQWEEDTLKLAREKEDRQEREKTEGNLTTLTDKDRHAFWQWAAGTAEPEASKYPWFDADYTRAERDSGIENVVHGLRRDLKVPHTPENSDDEDEDEFDDVEEEEDEADQSDQMDLDIQRPKPQDSATSTTDQVPKYTGPAMPMDNILRFMTKGEI